MFELLVSLVFSFFLGLIPAVIAKEKGYSFALWWFFGFMLFLIALPCAILMSRKYDPRDDEIVRRRSEPRYVPATKQPSSDTNELARLQARAEAAEAEAHQLRLEAEAKRLELEAIKAQAKLDALRKAKAPQA